MWFILKLFKSRINLNLATWQVGQPLQMNWVVTCSKFNLEMSSGTWLVSDPDVCLYMIYRYWISKLMWRSDEQNCMIYNYTWSGIILCIRPTNERWRYIATSSLIGWAHTQNMMIKISFRTWNCTQHQSAYHEHVNKQKCVLNLTHRGLMTPHGDIDLGQHWLR